MQVKGYKGDFIQWLRGFYYLARTKSFSKAAEEMHRNQGTLTYQIKRLEDDLQVSLVNRKTIPVQLTEKGELLYKLSLELFDILTRINTEVSGNEVVRGDVRIICNYGLSSQYLPSLLKSFKVQYPQIKVHVIPEKNANVTYKSSTPEVDFIITRDDFLEDGCQFYPLFNSSLSLVVSSSVSLSPEPSLEEIAKLNFLTLTSDGGIDIQIDKIFKENGYTIKSSMTESYFLASLRYVELELGASIMDNFLAHTKGFDVKIYSLDHILIPQVYGIAIKNNQYISPQADKLFKFLQQYNHNKSEKN